MAFPVNGTLDDFNRADTGPPPSANWSGPVEVGSDQIKVVSNEAKGASGAGGQDVWNVSTFSDCEAYVRELNISGGEYQGVWFRLTNYNTSSVSGYAVFTETSTNHVLYFRIDNDAFTQLGAFEALTLVEAMFIGASAIGSALQAYANTAASWAAVGSGRTDATYASGYIGMALSGTAALDDFGGGTLGTTSTPGDGVIAGDDDGDSFQFVRLG